MKSPFFFQQPSTRGEHMAYSGNTVATAAAEGDEVEITLSTCDVHMLKALHRMNKAHPGRRHSYPNIHDDVSGFTKGAIKLEIKDMRAGKTTLMEHELIKDGGIGFTITPIGEMFLAQNPLL